MSTCYGACAANWPPFISSAKARARVGAKQSLIGRTRRSDGRWQATYKGHPLYTFVKDTAKGDTNGEGLNIFGGEWDLVSPRGAKIGHNHTTVEARRRPADTADTAPKGNVRLDNAGGRPGAKGRSPRSTITEDTTDLLEGDTAMNT